MANKDSEQRITEEIQRDARKRAERALSQAREAAEKIRHQAAEDAQSEGKRILEETRDRVAGRRVMIVRSADQEISRRTLQARERLLQQVLDQARDALQRLPAETFRKVAVQLAAEAIRQMPGREFIVKVSGPADASLDSSSLASEIASLVGDEAEPRSIDVAVQPDLPVGVIVESADGRLRWDNTFQARLRRRRTDIRRAVASMLFEE